MDKQNSSETESLLDHEPKQRRRLFPPPKSFWVSVLFAGIYVNFINPLLFPRHDRHGSKDVNSEPFSWRNMSTKPDLEYVPCYQDEGDYQCARLELPMDYWNETTNATISLAVIKRPAVVPVTHSQYGGAIILNPGGPGGSGIFFLRGYGDHIRDVVEGHDADDKYFDLISFDPRGVGSTRPGVQCFDDAVSDMTWILRITEEGVFSSSDAAFSRIWALTQMRGGVCAMAHKDGEPDIKKYVSTASVARDMLEIVERHGEWREKEAKRLLEEEKPHVDVKLLESLEYRRGEEKINYLGFSYGSHLGNTFAVMFPDRINRLVVDGVVDSYDYTKSLWLDNLVDTEKDLDLFYYHCARVGYPLCALANENGTTAQEDVKKRTLNIVQSLYHNPLVVLSPYPDVIMYSDIKALILGALYSPLDVFPIMAVLLKGLESGDGGILSTFGMHDFNCSSCAEYYGQRRSAVEEEENSMFYDASMAVACSDGDDQSWVSKPEFRKHMETISKLSPTVGEIWANHRLRCIHYHVRPMHRFHGPWVGNTSFPILEVGNTADPVTPGRFAKKMAEGFPGAVALMQDTAGHCSASAPSRCTETYVRRYFQAGELPEPGTVCPSDAQPFGPGPDGSDAQDDGTLKAIRRAKDFAKAMHASGGGIAQGYKFQQRERCGR